MVAVNIEAQARFLAADNRKNDPDVKRVFWFPNEREVRLVELTDVIPTNLDGELHAFWFRASPKDNLPAPSRIALIQPREFGKLRLPSDWGDWQVAKEI